MTHSQDHPHSAAPEAPEPAQPAAQVDELRYAVAENAALYRAVVGVLLQAKERYRLQLRVAEVARALPGEDEETLTHALDQLTAWGNLKRTQDTREVSTLAELARRRSLYQLTPRGEAAHRAVLAVDRVDQQSGRLSAVMLPEIRGRLRALAAELASEQPDPARLYTLLGELHAHAAWPGPSPPPTRRRWWPSRTRCSSRSTPRPPTAAPGAAATG